MIVWNVKNLFRNNSMINWIWNKKSYTTYYIISLSDESELIVFKKILCICTWRFLIIFLHDRFAPFETCFSPRSFFNERRSRVPRLNNRGTNVVTVSSKFIRGRIILWNAVIEIEFRWPSFRWKRGSSCLEILLEFFLDRQRKRTKKFE